MGTYGALIPGAARPTQPPAGVPGRCRSARQPGQPLDGSGPALQLEGLAPNRPNPPNVPWPHGHARQVPRRATFISGPGTRRQLLHRGGHTSLAVKHAPGPDGGIHWPTLNLTPTSTSTLSLNRPPPPRPTLRHHDTRAAVPWFAARPPSSRPLITPRIDRLRRGRPLDDHGVKALPRFALALLLCAPASQPAYPLAATAPW